MLSSIINTIAVNGPHFKQTVAGILSVDSFKCALNNRWVVNTSENETKRHTLNYLLCLYNNNYMDNRECTIISIISYTNNRFTCYVKKVCINLTNSMYACLICLSLFFINLLHKKLYFFWVVKVLWNISDGDNIFSIANCTICKYDTA